MTPIKRSKIALALIVATGVSACGGSSTSDSTSTPNPTPVDNPPVVNAGEDQVITSGATVTLSATVDDDGEYTVTWIQTVGPSVSLSSQTAQTITFVAPNVSENTELTFEISADDGVNSVVTDSITITVEPSVINPDPDPKPDPDPQPDSVWILNTEDTRAAHIREDNSSLGVLVNVQSVEDVEVSGAQYTVVSSEGIPDYSVVITQEIYEGLTTRPRANTDFIGGVPSVSVGDVVEFGEDIGYNSNQNCGDNEGYGYWPPGPDCPTQSTREGYLPKEPTATQEACATGLGKVGLWVNGSSVYNWGDGQSYNNQGTWNNLAPVAEVYDVDICGGHAAQGDYHHHFYSSCLADMVGDQANGHSPLYGFAADGYPIYGPWEAEGQLANSAWVVRDYSAGSATGCSDGVRSCQLVDSYDVTQGTESVSAGPGFTTIVETLSGNQLVASNGYYKQDYYWNSSLTAQGSPYLDQYNGHTDAEHGYHYHVTVAEQDSKLVPAFPYIVGERFAGQLQDNSVASCSTGGGMGPPPGARPGSQKGITQ